MSVIRSFRCVRPAPDKAAAIAALPYDVYNRTEAKRKVEENPLSFLKIDRAETQFADDYDMYAPEVYEKAKSTFQEMLSDESFLRDEEKHLYLYALTYAGHTQTGIVGCASIDDYLDGTIRKHENTRAEKEADRIRHVDVMSAQTGPIFLAYRQNDCLKRLTDEAKNAPPLYDFTGDDEVRHQVWRLETDVSDRISQIFDGVDRLYIADGHHRAASAVRVGLKRRREHPGYDGSEEFNYFLAVAFPENELHIYDYNRVVEGWNAHSLKELMQDIRQNFEVEEVLSVSQQSGWTDSKGKSGIQNEESGDGFSEMVFRPSKKGEIGMYCGGKWYCLTAHKNLYTGDPVHDLDVSVLQEYILDPILGIHDPKTDERIRFVGGIRGVKELVRAVDSMTEAIAFAMYPTSMAELLKVADAGRLMPPKSTWFEPKLRSGLFIHEIER